MDLKQDIEKLAEQLIQRIPYITNEESTKQSLIIPFIQKLNYDVFNPLEVEPEYTSDFGFKKGEKVDYAIKEGNMPILFIEAKPVDEEVVKHSSQLYRYFNATPSVRFSILTNGMDYKFFTDLNQDNIMDDEPFYSLNLSNLSNLDIEVIQKITRENFNKNDLINFSQELVYLKNINCALKDLFRDPSDDFIRFLIKDINNQRVTNTVIEKFKPIVKKSINQTLLAMIGEGLSKNEDTEVLEKEKIDLLTSMPSEYKDMTKDKKGIVTSEDELKGYRLVEEVLLSSDRDVTDLKYKDTLSYFGIMKRVTTKWFIRLNFESEQKSVFLRIKGDVCKNMLPDYVVNESKEGCRVYINKIEDIKDIKDVIIHAFDNIDK